MTRWQQRSRWCRLPLMGLVAAGLAAGCGSDVDQAARDGILLFGNDAEPQGLDPHLVSGFTEHKILIGLFEGLTSLDIATLDPIPAAAASWTVSDDETVYTFTIRDDAKWSNGDPLTAHDFVYGWRRNLTPALGSEYAYMLHCIVNAKAYNEGQIDDFEQVGVKALDDHTLEVRLNHPTPYFLDMQQHFSWYPVHQATIEQHGQMTDRESPWTLAGNLVGNGPFRLAEWAPNSVIRFEKNEHYWDAENVALNGVKIFPYSIPVAERAFRAGDLHMTSDIPITKIDVYRAENPDALKIHPIYATYFYTFNVTEPPFDDVRVRKAFAMALNGQAIVDNITKGSETVAHHLTPPDPDGFTCRSALPYDLEQARALLAEAGYPGGAGMPPIELLYNTSENHKLIAEAIQQMWERDLGVRVSLVNQEWKVYLDSRTNLDYQVARAGWYGDYVDPINFLECYVTDGGNNRTGWSNAEFDALIDQARAELDPAARNELLQQAEAILLEEVPIAPIYFYTRKILVSPHVQGWQPNLMSHVPYQALSLRAPQP